MKFQRMCAVCRYLKDKRELLRFVKKDGIVMFDISGKILGRGAYICKTEECIKKARKARALERSFSCKVEETIYDCLEEYGKDE